MVKNSADALLHIINELLDFSRVEAGRLYLDHAFFDPRKHLAEILKTHAASAANQQVDLVLDVHRDVPAHVGGDPGRLRQVVTNLVGNAIKFTRSGEVVVQVTPAEANNRECRLRFSVSDTGIGIPPDKQDMIFEAFAQVEDSKTRHHGGTGLGLAICKRIVEAMQGSIWVESELDQGSTFHFTVLLGKGGAGSRPASAFRALADRRILIVSDSEASRHALRELFATWKLEPVLADAASLEREDVQGTASSASFDLILADCSIHSEWNEALLRALSTEAYRHIPVLQMLPFAEYHRREKRLTAEYHQRLCKPFSPEELLEAMLRHFQIDSPDSELADGKHTSSARDADAPGESQLHVLLVEDDTTNQVLGRRLLEKLGHTCEVVANGAEALERVDRPEAPGIDLVFMDLHMPKMNGLEATKALRDREETSGGHLPIIALTADAMPGDKEKCLQAGMDDYLSKPIRLEALRSMVQHWQARIAKGFTPARAPARSPGIFFDAQTVLEQMGGDEAALMDLLEITQKNLPLLYAQLREAHRKGAAEDLSWIARRMTGVAETLAAKDLRALAIRLEQAATENTAGLDDILEELRLTIRNLDIALEAYHA